MQAKVINKLYGLRKDIEAKVLKIQEVQMEELRKEVEASLKKDASETLKYASPRGERMEDGFSGASPKITSEITVKPKGVELKVSMVIVDKRTGNPHDIWHLINEGGQRLYKENRRVRIRRERRTEVDTLMVDDFKGYTDDWFTATKGEKTPYIKGRNWYSIMTKNLEERIKTKFTTNIRFKN